jgi:dTDP-4-dehydrorhamnose 3,5-epimerase
MRLELPIGVELLRLATHTDDRGDFTELFRESWVAPDRFLQWNAVNSEARALRGVHVHVRHSDYLTVMRGRVLFGLKDLRVDSPTLGMVSMLEVAAGDGSALRIPPGVAHGFYFLEASLHVYAVSHYWDLDDELGCRFDDPGLGMPWPDLHPLLSERDQHLPSLAALSSELLKHRPCTGSPSSPAPGSS